jgi:predicted kinase
MAIICQRLRDTYRHAMPRLIHLNGPSGVGQSTLAHRYANQHPGTLVLDLDVLAGLIGGWSENFSAALESARGHGLEMATRHLRDGHDVVLPQLVTVHDRAHDPALEQAAQSADATYVEVALMIDEQEHFHRLHARCPSNNVQARVQAALVDPESDLVDRIRGHLREYLAGRPGAIRLDTTGLEEDRAYERLLIALKAA